MFLDPIFLRQAGKPIEDISGNIDSILRVVDIRKITDPIYLNPNMDTIICKQGPVNTCEPGFLHLDKDFITIFQGEPKDGNFNYDNSSDSIKAMWTRERPANSQIFLMGGPTGMWLSL